MCNYCESNGWTRKTCNFCGVDTQGGVEIVILIATNDSNEFPYTETALCKKCWEKHGIEPAFEHNDSCRETMGIKSKIKRVCK